MRFFGVGGRPTANIFVRSVATPSPPITAPLTIALVVAPDFLKPVMDAGKVGTVCFRTVSTAEVKRLLHRGVQSLRQNAGGQVHALHPNLRAGHACGNRCAPMSLPLRVGIRGRQLGEGRG